MPDNFENSIPLAGNEASMPYDSEAEQAVLGASILYPQDVFPIVAEKLKQDYFYIDQHKQLFGILLQMFTSGEKIDAITVSDEATARKVFESKNETNNYVYKIMDIVPSIGNINSYCKIIAQKYYIRSLAMSARQILSEIESGENDAELLLDSAEQKIYDIRQGRDVGGVTKLSDAVYDAYDQIGKLSGPEREKYLGARSGFDSLDAVISGLNKSDLIILAARPGMGKTSFALNIAENVAAREPEKQIVIFSLEMSKQQLATRMLSSLAMVESNRLRDGSVQDDEWVALATAAGKLCNYNIYIDDQSAITVQQMKAKLRRLDNVGLVIIDYLQLMSSGLKTDNQVQIISDITRQMKIMAKELDVPVILLSQLSRATEGRTDKRPVLSDLRDSGSIEQDADIVMFLYRDGYYHDDAENQNECECIVAKNRHGETRTVKIGWQGKYTKFTNLELNANEE